MRVFSVALMALSCGGCATTVHRLDGEFSTPAGLARTECEKRDWLVVAPTRAEFVDKHGVRSQTRDDGVGLYLVGEKRPVAIPSLSDDMGGGPVFERHGSGVRQHDTKQAVATGLGIAGTLAVAAGTILFVTAFESKANALGDKEQQINAGRAIAGGVSVGVGFGLGIAGIAVNPGQAERSRAEAARYVFLPPEDARDDVVEMTARYNQAVRERCKNPPAP
jgi:hypothetical protein